MKIVFFGTSEIGTKIFHDLHAKHQILLAITSPDQKVGRKKILTESPISKLCNELKIPTLKPEAVKGNKELLKQLEDLRADIFIVVSYGKILPEELINIPDLKTINIHFSLLPLYRGAAPVQYALLNGEKSTGTSIFILDKQMDTGPILAQAELPINPTETNPELQKRLSVLSSQLLIQLLPKYKSGEIKPKPQNHEQASYTKLIQKSDGQINWQNSAQKIYNQFRAYDPWPGIYTTWNGKMLKILQCKVAEQSSISNSVGQVQSNLIQCGNESVLEITTVQLEGKGPVSIAEFLNGHPEFKTATLS